MKFLAYGCLAVASIFLAGCAADHEDAYLAPVNLQPSGPAQLGSGRYLYQFELRDAAYALEPNRPFALSTQNMRGHGLPFVADVKKVYQGVTDAQGRTPVIALPFRVKPANWRLRERFGSGPNGEDFHLTGPKGKKGLSGMDYVLVVCSKPPRHYQGVSNAQGYTAYVATERAEQVLVYVDGDDDDLDAKARDGCEAEKGA